MLKIQVKSKSIFVVALLLVLFLTVGIVSANDVSIDDKDNIYNDNIQTTSSNVDVRENIQGFGNEDYDNTVSGTSNAGNSGKVKDSNEVYDFSTLNETIFNSTGSEIVLRHNYTFDNKTDYRFIESGGIIINDRDLTINGQGHTIDCAGLVRFLNVANHTITLKNINIINGRIMVENNEGIVYISNGNGTFVNSTFTNNNVTAEKGNYSAVVFLDNSRGTFLNCIFSSNFASYAGNVYINKGLGNFSECLFNNNSGEYSVIIYQDMENNRKPNSVFENCNFTNHQTDSVIYIESGIATFINSIFTNNRAIESDGIVYIKECLANFTKCSFTDNIGGAVHIDDGNGTFKGCTFSNNGYGNQSFTDGTVYISGNGNFTDCSFSGNNASSGGAVYIDRSFPTPEGYGIFVRCSFSGNQAHLLGGAVSARSADFKDCNFTGNNVTFNDSVGGAVFIDCYDGQFENCLFINNYAPTNGSAVYISCSNGVFNNVNFTSNRGKQGTVYIQEGDGTFVDCSFSFNTAREFYGGVYVHSGVGNFTGCTFLGNSAKDHAGAVEVVGNGFFTSCTFSNNSCPNNDGGAVRMVGNGTFVDCSFSGNSAKFEGGAVTLSGSGIFTGCSFISNHGGNGGAVYVANSGSANFENCNFTGNYVENIETGYGYGGAVYLSGCDGQFVSCIFSSNNATENGGAILINNGNCNFTGCYFTNNVAPNGSAISCINSSSVVLYNSNFTGNVNPIMADSYQNVLIDSATRDMSDENLTNFAVYMSMSVENFYYGATGYIFVNLTNNKGLQIEDGIVYVTISDKTYTGPVSYGMGIIELTDITPGKYDVNVFYNGSAIYFKTFALTNFTVYRYNSTINVSAVNVEYGELVNILVTTECADSMVYLVINHNYYNTTLVGGKGVINITEILNIGYYAVNVTYKGTDDYSPCEALVQFNVTKIHSDMNVTTEDVLIGSDVLINVNTNCPDSVVFVVVNGKTYSTTLVGGIGVINIPGLSAGSYELNVTYNGTETYAPCVKLVNFTVFKHNSTIDVSAEDVVYGSDVLINVNTNCPDSVVFVVVNGKTYSTTLVDGIGVIKITDELEGGHYELNVTYNGTEEYNPCVALVKFQVYKHNSTINVSAEDVVYGSDVLINVSTDCEDCVVSAVVNKKTYSTTLVGGKGVINITGLGAGEYSDIKVHYAGTHDYRACDAYVNFTVVKANSTIDVSAGDVVYGSDVLINVSTPCDDSVVFVVVNNKTYSTTLVGGKGVINITEILNAGYYEFNVTYNGSANYNLCVGLVNFTVVKADSTINVSADDIGYGSDVLINVSTDCDDSVVFVVVNNKTYSTTLVDGKGVINITELLDTGFYEFNVTYNGSANYNPCVALVNFTVVKANSTIDVSAGDVVYGSNILINVSTRCDDSVVYVVVNNNTYSVNLVGGIGVINVTELLDIGYYEFNVTYNGSVNFNPCVKMVNFSVTKIPTSIIAKSANFVINYPGVYKVSFSPKLAGVNLVFTLSGKKIGSAVTDSSGNAQIKITAAQLKAAGAGNKYLVVQFAGNDTYAPYSAKVKVTINKEATKLLNVKTAKKSYKSTAKSMQLTATLKDSKNKVIKNQVLYFKVNNKKTFKVKTNSKGIAKLTLNSANIKACKLNKKGKYKFTVTYKTTATYKQVSKNGFITVLK